MIESDINKRYCQSCGMPLRFDIEKYLGISTLALIPMNRAEDENSDKRKSSNNNNGKVMKSLNDAKSKIFKS